MKICGRELQENVIIWIEREAPYQYPIRMRLELAGGSAAVVVPTKREHYCCCCCCWMKLPRRPMAAEPRPALRPPLPVRPPLCESAALVRTNGAAPVTSRSPSGATFRCPAPARPTPYAPPPPPAPDADPSPLRPLPLLLSSGTVVPATDRPSGRRSAELPPVGVERWLPATELSAGDAAASDAGEEA